MQWIVYNIQTLHWPIQGLICNIKNMSCRIETCCEFIDLHLLLCKHEHAGTLACTLDDQRVYLQPRSEQWWWDSCCSSELSQPRESGKHKFNDLTFPKAPVPKVGSCYITWTWAKTCECLLAVKCTHVKTKLTSLWSTLVKSTPFTSTIWSPI